MALDFSLLGQGPQFQNVLASYQAGAEQRKATDTKNALSQYQTDPEAAIGALNKVDPVLALKLRADQRTQQADAAKKAVFQQTDPIARASAAAATGNPEIIQAVTGMDKETREQHKVATDAVGGFAFGLRGKVQDIAQRKAMILQNKDGLVAAGMKPEEVDNFEPTDANLDGLVARMQTLDQAFKYADQKTDNDRQAATAAETARHNLAMEGVAGQNANSNTIRANKPPAAKSGAASATANAPWKKDWR